MVAYCTQPRNGARIIPDGALKSAHVSPYVLLDALEWDDRLMDIMLLDMVVQFVKTPLYVQISGVWDGTQVDIVGGDYGGELDPHGATGTSSSFVLCLFSHIVDKG